MSRKIYYVMPFAYDYTFVAILQGKLFIYFAVGLSNM